jgi:hypothetical protein
MNYFKDADTLLVVRMGCFLALGILPGCSLTSTQPTASPYITQTPSYFDPSNTLRSFMTPTELVEHSSTNMSLLPQETLLPTNPPLCISVNLPTAGDWVNCYSESYGFVIGYPTNSIVEAMTDNAVIVPLNAPGGINGKLKPLNIE